jgi:hypothetical protein
MITPSAKQQPPHLLAAVLPEILLSQSTEWMFPTSWHVSMNIVWGIQIWILFLHCIWVGRWLPCQWEYSRRLEKALFDEVTDDEMEGLNSSKVNTKILKTEALLWCPSWTVWQFWVMLVTHSIFYIMEIDCTSITIYYVPMGALL